MKLRRRSPALLIRLAPLFVGTLLAFVPTADARIVALGPAVQANTSPVHELGMRLEMVAEAGGGFVVVWSSFETSTTALHFDALGGRGSEFELFAVLDLQSIAPAKAGFVIASDAGILKAFLNDGSAVGSASVSGLADSYGGWALNSTPQGDLVYVWSQDVGELSGQRFSGDLQPLGPVFRVEDQFANPNGLRIGTTAQGSFVVVWWDESGTEIWARAVDGQNQPVGQPFVVAAGVHSSGPSVCFDDSGNFAVAWQGGRCMSGFRRYNAEREPISPRLYGGGTGGVLCLPGGTTIVADDLFVVSHFESDLIGFMIRAVDPPSQLQGELFVPAWNLVARTAARLGDDTFVVAWAVCTDRASCNVFTQRFAVVSGAHCSGDCTADGTVTIDEVILGVHIALYGDPWYTILYDEPDCRAALECPGLDTDLDGQASVDEIVAAVNKALGGCD